jgi:type I restriction enzyme, S subunit
MEITTTKNKQTEESLMPLGWSVKKIKDISPLQRGFDLTSSELVKGKYPVVYSNGIGFYHSEYMVIGPGVITGRSGTLGKIHYLSDNFWAHNTTLWVTNFFNNNPKFIYYLLQFVGIERFGSGSGVPTLNRNDVHDYKIAIPLNNKEQKAIAQVLSNTDALIKALKKKITKKKLIKKGVMQKLLTPNEDWEVKILGELAEFYKGRGLPKSEIIQEGKYKCLHYGELFTKYKEEIITIFSKTNTSENVFFSKSNDVLMPTSDVTPNGLATASCIREDNIILGGDVMVIRFSNQIINGIFLSYYITQNRKQVMQLVSGSTVYHLYGSDMSNFVLSYPNIEEQNLIVQTLSDMDKEISHLEKKLSKYQLAKQGMMQKLLTGKIRLV